MGILSIICIAFGLIQLAISTAETFETPVHLYKPPSSHKSPKEHILINVQPSDNKSTDRLENRDYWKREIVEITAGDPTTDSTLHVPNYGIDCVNEKECESVRAETTPMPTFRPYSQEELNVFLKKYVETNGKYPDQPTNKLANLYMDEPVNVLEGSKESGKTQEKSKSWQLMQAHAHNHPYDDKTGWVTLEPIPWSASQVQKWEPNNRPQTPQWEKPGYQQQYQQQTSSPPWNKPNNKWQDRPWSNKPTYEYPSSPKPQSNWNDNKFSSKPSGWPSDNWGSSSDIITDGGPSHFPSDPPKKPTWYDRPHTEIVYHEGKEPYQPNSNPSEGDGHWVLLSSTKGYSVPHRNRAFQRALLINSQSPTKNGVPSVKSHRSVRLTVLPPMNGTNTTTSHGGLLEVEQTFQTVDEAQREHAAKMLRLETVNRTSSGPPPPPPVAAKRSGTAVRVYPIRSPQSQARGNAVLAAVGAGMVPATMAMLLPMVLGKRRRRSIEHPFNVFRPNHLFND
ncbi:uncharacterized protein LOC106662709 [Cimex lectularius]|uniref:CPR type cuticle protein n=1 Tax=Cimex lectularius TaxID=79782 RepID=A0A8I6RFT4_CIMLE|nr:uncharacterized protein LOC106662709 [Cimex lectularius]